MNRSIFGRTISPALAWAAVHPERFTTPLDALPWRLSPFAARSHAVDVRKGDLIALHASASEPEHITRNAALRLREAHDTTTPTHREPYRALAGRIVAVATLAGATTRTERDPWRSVAVREALGVAGEWWALLGPVLVLPRPVECSGDLGLWSLSREVCCAVMDQVRALEAAREGAARGAA